MSSGPLSVGRLWRHRSATLAVVLAVAVATLTLDAGTAEAKILPYGLEVHPTRVEVGRPITIVVTLDPQNSLGDQFDWEIAVFRESAMTKDGWPRKHARPVKKVTMELASASDRTYQGSFTGTKSGRYVVVGTTAQPMRGSEPRCLSANSGTKLRCWPSPVPVTVRASS